MAKSKSPGQLRAWVLGVGSEAPSLLGRFSALRDSAASSLAQRSSDQ